MEKSQNQQLIDNVGLTEGRNRHHNFFKEQSSEIFVFRLFHDWTLLKPLTRHMSDFQIWLQI
jgi:hypothetical protein